MKRFLSTAQVLDKTALGRTTLFTRIREGTFPKPIKLGHCTNVYLESEVDAWMDAQLAGRQA
jgi:prophage regulatory protein